MSDFNAKTQYNPFYHRVRDRIKSAYGRAASLPGHKQLGLVMSATSLGLGVNNYMFNRSRSNQVQQQVEVQTELDKKSLTALNKIHKALQDTKTTK